MNSLEESCVIRLSTWNVRGINGDAKRDEVVHVFRKGELELLALKMRE